MSRVLKRRASCKAMLDRHQAVLQVISVQIQLAEVGVPQVDTRLTMWTDTSEATGYFREGFAFSPMYTIGIKKTVKGKGELRTWLKVEKAS